MKGDDAHQWQDAARAEMQNSHGVYVEVSEDQLPSWNSSTRRAHEVIVMMWVLRIKKDEKCEAATKVQGTRRRMRQPTKAQGDCSGI
eukprot:3807283-Pleurochrysis_carterae.AAC.1